MTDYGRDLLFGGCLAPDGRRAERCVALARRCEHAGLDLVSFPVRPGRAEALDAWTLLGYAAARTTSIRLFPSVPGLPPRLPASVARTAASLHRLAGGRVDLGIGADESLGAGGLPAPAVAAVAEAIDVIREIGDAPEPGALAGESDVHGGDAPAGRIGLWLGGHEPRMLALTGQKADGWLAAPARLTRGDLVDGNARIDEAAHAAGRDPADIRRLVAIAGPGPNGRAGARQATASQAERLAELALRDGISAFLLASDEEAALERFGREVAPAVRELVATARGPRPAAGRSPASPAAQWDEASRPTWPGPPAESAAPTARGRAVAAHLIDVHDHLRRELSRIRDLLGQVRAGALDAAAARTAINEMTVRQNDWTLGAYCASYCRIVTGHHGLEDEAIFPHLSAREPGLRPVIDRLGGEHVVIHRLLAALDEALVALVRGPGDLSGVQGALDAVGDALLSHLAYEEEQLSGPLARHGFYPGQV